MVSVVLDKVATDFFIPISIYLGKAGINSIPGLAEVVFLKTHDPEGAVRHDRVFDVGVVGAGLDLSTFQVKQ